MVKIEDTVRNLEEIIPHLIEKNDVIGLSVTLIQNGDVFWNKGFGFANLQSKIPITEKTVFEIASLTKPIIANLTLILVEQKKLDLDIPLLSYLINPQLHNQSLEGQITARHVLTHSTGFPNWGEIRGSPKIFFIPGERFSYSGEGFMYLQKVLEKVSGKDLESIAQELLFRPLGLTHASFLWRKDIEEMGAIGYLRDNTPKNMKPSISTAAGSLHISPRDYAKILIQLMNSDEPNEFRLSNVLIDEMLSPKIPVSDAGLSDRHTWPKSKIKESNSVFWGLGWGLEKVENRINAWHWGNNGSFQHIVFWNRAEKYGFIVFSNCERVPFIWEELLKIGFPGPHPGLDWLFSHYF
ncbi:MAG: serine hydrolase domain-containing protein [Promethearchaeota archaeon]